MLVLSRQRDETIMIGDDVEITVVDIRGDKVRLGITAPAHIPVHRKEVYEAIRRENRAASQVKPEDLQALTGRPPNGKGGTGKTPPVPPVVCAPDRKKIRPRHEQHRKPDSNNKNKPRNSSNLDPGCEGTQTGG